jgi:hypothetical protein
MTAKGIGGAPTCFTQNVHPICIFSIIRMSLVQFFMMMATLKKLGIFEFYVDSE